MEYFAGIFDAEGTLSLNKNGSFPISIEMANEEIPNLFKKHFGGSIYTRKRKDRKKTWTWKINSIAHEALFFIECISPHSRIKKEQLFLLREYLHKSRADRKNDRLQFSTSIRLCKQPNHPYIEIRLCKENLHSTCFYKWLAGIIDGDGNFVCNQYTDNRNGKKYFGRQISIASIYKQLIDHIRMRIPGCVIQCKSSRNLLYKWTCKRSEEKSLCQDILPFLRIKKQQCFLYLQFMQKIPSERSYEIINEIKHLNSL